MCIPGVKKQGFCKRNSEFYLRDEARFLRGVRRIVPVEVQAAFADGDDLRMPGHFPQGSHRVPVEILGVVRVHADGAAEQSAQAVRARAYTVGHQVVFGAGQFAPSSRETWHDSSRTSTVMTRPAPLIRATCRHSNPMLPWPRMATSQAVPRAERTASVLRIAFS